MTGFAAPNFIAGGDIPASIFVKLSGSRDREVVACTADDEAIGVSHEGTRDAPITGITPLTAKDDEPVMVYTDGIPCEVISGEDITVGDKLVPDADGYAVPLSAGSASSGDVFSAIALSGATSGERVKVVVRRGTFD